jgi:hypothetical protein
LRRVAEGAHHAPDFALGQITYEIPLPDAEKIICVGVNYPDRNEEYKDGQAAPSNPSLFPRFARSFTGHNLPLIRPPESPQLDYEGEIVLVIGKVGDAYRKLLRWIISRGCRCATKARSATGCGMRNSTSRREEFRPQRLDRPLADTVHGRGPDRRHPA